MAENKLAAQDRVPDATDALFEEKERAAVTLNSIGDAVMSTDIAGLVTYLNVVAEGVETREQLAFLQERSCPEGQGHYFSEPVGASEFNHLLGRNE
jgi:sensor c-di-GMP phosphodiesterase-like protein